MAHAPPLTGGTVKRPDGSSVKAATMSSYANSAGGWSIGSLQPAHQRDNIPQGTTLASLMVTSACDLACTYCPPELHANAAALSMDDFRGVLDQLEAADVRQLALGGGEPMLWPHLDQAVSEARDRGFSVALTTNSRDPDRAGRIPLDGLAVSVGKGNWRQLGSKPDAVAIVLHEGGRLARTLGWVRKALDAGYRRLAFVAYKGPEGGRRGTEAELGLLAWLAGQLRQSGCEAALDAYTYRRLGLARTCGDGFARLSVDGHWQGCSFTGCEYYPDRARRFGAEQQAGQAAPPIRPRLLIEHSEPGYVVELSDSLEASLRHFSWELVLDALDELKNIGKALGREHAEIAAQFTTQYAGDGHGVPPQLGALGIEEGGEKLLQQILSAATRSPLASRTPRHSILLEDGAVTRRDYVRDLAETLLQLTQETASVPAEVREARYAYAQSVVDYAASVVDGHLPRFGAAFARAARDAVRPELDRLASLEATGVRSRIEQHMPTADDPEFFGWASLAAGYNLDFASAYTAYLISLPTLAARLGRTLALYQQARRCPWVRSTLSALMREARQEYTADGYAAVRSAVDVARRRWEIRTHDLTTVPTRDVPRVSDRLAAHRRARVVEALSRLLPARRSSPDEWLSPSLLDQVVLRSWHDRLLLSAFTRVASEDEPLAIAADWESWPAYLPSATGDVVSLLPTTFPVEFYLLNSFLASDVPADQRLVWVHFACGLTDRERAHHFIEVTLAELAPAMQLAVLERLPSRFEELIDRHLVVLAQDPDPSVSIRASRLRAKTAEDRRRRQVYRWRLGPATEPGEVMDDEPSTQ